MPDRIKKLKATFSNPHTYSVNGSVKTADYSPGVGNHTVLLMDGVRPYVSLDGNASRSTNHSTFKMAS